MNILKLKLFESFKTNNAKVLFLAGLIGLASSCKMNENEPDQNNGSRGFMQHIPTVDNVVFYSAEEDAQSFSFQTDENNNVTGLTILRDANNGKSKIYNPMKLIPTVKDGGYYFISPKYWEYNVADQEGSDIDWGIYYVTDEEYNKYKNMTNQELADLAKNRIESKNPEDATYAEKVYENILKGNGVWKQNEYQRISFFSEGNKQKLECSDFGMFCFLRERGVPAFVPIEKSSRHYFGGLSSKEIDKSKVQPQKFKLTAFGKITVGDMYNEDRSTVKSFSTLDDSATLIVDALQRETIVMPFTNWYKVTIIRTNNSVVSKFENTNSTISSIWQVSQPNTLETDYREYVQGNGLPVKCGFYGDENQDGFTTTTSIKYYDVNGDGIVDEFCGQVNRKSADRIVAIVFGGKNR